MKRRTYSSWEQFVLFSEEDGDRIVLGPTIRILISFAKWQIPLLVLCSIALVALAINSDRTWLDGIQLVAPLLCWFGALIGLFYALAFWRREEIRIENGFVRTRRGRFPPTFTKEEPLHNFESIAFWFDADGGEGAQSLIRSNDKTKVGAFTTIELRHKNERKAWRFRGSFMTPGSRMSN